MGGGGTLAPLPPALEGAPDIMGRKKPKERALGPVATVSFKLATAKHAPVDLEPPGEECPMVDRGIGLMIDTVEFAVTHAAMDLLRAAVQVRPRHTHTHTHMFFVDTLTLFRGRNSTPVARVPTHVRVCARARMRARGPPHLLTVPLQAVANVSILPRVQAVVLGAGGVDAVCGLLHTYWDVPPVVNAVMCVIINFGRTVSPSFRCECASVCVCVCVCVCLSPRPCLCALLSCL